MRAECPEIGTESLRFFLFLCRVCSIILSQGEMDRQDEGGIFAVTGRFPFGHRLYYPYGFLVQPRVNATYHFHIRDGAVWSYGKADAYFPFNTILDG